MQLYTVLQGSLGTVLAMAVVVVAILSVMVETRSYNNGLIFYDPQTRNLFLPPTVSVARGRSLAGLKYSAKGSIWSTFGKPCECAGSICGCCAGIQVKQYNFDQKMCANVTFLSQQRVLLDIFLNDKPSARYGISARNPSPFCIPVMLGVPMAMCVQMSDVALMDNNLNMCMDFIVRLATTDLFEMHFQCMRMGLDGLQYLDKNGQPLLTPGQRRQATKNEERSDEEVDEYEYYDESEKSGGDIDSSENRVESDDKAGAVLEVGASGEGTKKAATGLVGKSENGSNGGSDDGDYNGDDDNEKELLDIADDEGFDGDAKIAKSSVTQQTALNKATKSGEKWNGNAATLSAKKSAVDYMNNLKNAMNATATKTMPPLRTTAPTATAKSPQTTNILMHDAAAAANVAASEEAAATAASSVNDESADDEVANEEPRYEDEYDEEAATEHTAPTPSPWLKRRVTLQAAANRRSKVFNYI